MFSVKGRSQRNKVAPSDSGDLDRMEAVGLGVLAGAAICANAESEWGSSD